MIFNAVVLVIYIYVYPVLLREHMHTIGGAYGTALAVYQDYPTPYES